MLTAEPGLSKKRWNGKRKSQTYSCLYKVFIWTKSVGLLEYSAGTNSDSLSRGKYSRTAEIWVATTICNIIWYFENCFKTSTCWLHTRLGHEMHRQLRIRRERIEWDGFFVSLNLSDVFLDRVFLRVGRLNYFYWIKYEHISLSTTFSWWFLVNLFIRYMNSALMFSFLQSVKWGSSAKLVLLSIFQ